MCLGVLGVIAMADQTQGFDMDRYEDELDGIVSEVIPDKEDPR